MNRKHIVNCIAVALLLMMFALALGSARLKSPTMDEQNHIARGAAYLLTGDLRLSVEHPPLVNTLSALPLLLCPQLELPLEHPSWQNGAWYVFADQFLWQANAHQVECIVFLSRLLVMALGLLLGALLYRWAREMGGERAGLLALFLLVCDPNILAHTRLVTTDLGVTFFVFLALYTLWRVWGRQAPHLGEQVLRHWGNVILAGIALGLALTAKFSALLLIPLFALMAFYQAITHKTPRPLITLLAIFALAALSLWAVYGFEIGPLSPGGLPLPAPSYLNGVRAILQRTEGGNPAFLLGRYSTTGWWYYFPLAFLVKTPLPTLLLLAASLISTLRRRAWNRDLFLLIPMAAFFGVNLFSHLNIGYRHLLPALPFAFVYVSQRISSKFLLADAKPRILNSKPGTLNPKPGTLNLKQVVGGLLAAWYLISAVLIYPDYLTYFNELAGGSSNGYRWLVDSNLDWGQDLPGLQRYVEEHGLKEIYLSWFGSARPEHYGISYRPLPGYPLHQGEAETFAFNPYHPAPGTYAISVSNLQGVALRDPDTFLWFRQRQPTARIGNSIFIYEVPAEESEGTVCLGGVHLSDLDSATVEALLQRYVHIKTFAPQTSLVWPETGPLWLITSDVAPFDSALRETVMQQGKSIAEHGDYRVIHLADTQALDRWLAALTACSQAWWSPATAFPVDEPLREAMPLSLPADFAHRIALLGYQNTEGPLHPGEAFTVTSAWRVLDQSKPPLAIFVHLLSPEGQLVTGWDGLDVASLSWVEGDTFVQVHHLTVPAEADPGEYLLELGVYSPETLARWPISVSATDTTDRVLLALVQVGEGQ